MRSATAPTPSPSSSPPVFAPDAATPDAARAPRAFGVYVHWPFCRAKCPYCDFNSHVRARIDHARWRRALLAEIAYYAGLVPGRTVASIFFGGGTPTLMEPETLAACVEAVRSLWPVAPDLEITMEANPTSVEAARLGDFRDAGVNRISLGVQALDDAALAALGREHTAAEALKALALAGEAVARVSFDLIYARPGQSLAAWRAELARALALAAGHLSLYQLTIEPGTPFAARQRRGDLILPGDGLAADLFEATQEMTAAAGLTAYEVSNHARPGEESRHNLVYWRYGDYVGVGPGAHGRITVRGAIRATRQHRAPEAWLALVEKGGHGTKAVDALAPEAAATEMVLMGLRLAEGVDLDRLAERTGVAPAVVLDAQALDRLEDAGFIRRDGARIRATATGRLRLDAVLAALLR